MLINYLIKEIVLYDDRIDIYYNSPITKTTNIFAEKFVRF